MGYNLIAETVFRNERHDLDRVYAVYPRDHPNNPTPGETYRMTLREDLARPGIRMYRADIILVNARRRHCETCTCEGTLEQFAVDVTSSGNLTGPDEAFHLMSAADLAWAKAEAKRMLATAAECPEFGNAFLYGDRW